MLSLCSVLFGWNFLISRSIVGFIAVVETILAQNPPNERFHRGLIIQVVVIGNGIRGPFAFSAKTQTNRLATSGKWKLQRQTDDKDITDEDDVECDSIEPKEDGTPTEGCLPPLVIFLFGFHLIHQL